MVAPTHLVGLALLLLGLSLASVLLRRSFLAVLVGVQGIFVAASLALVGFSRMRVALGVDDPAGLSIAEGHALLVLAVGAAEVAVEVEIDLVVLAEFVLLWKEPVVCEEAHIAQAQNILGHGGNIKMRLLVGNDVAPHKILFKKKWNKNGQIILGHTLCFLF